MKRLVLLAVWLSPLALFVRAQPRFEVDPTWPKPLPEKWITGQLSGVCVDSHDHVVVVNRRNITDEEAETSINAPSIIMFDAAGNVIKSWGDPNVIANSIHGCSFDTEDNVWVDSKWGWHRPVVQPRWTGTSGTRTFLRERCPKKTSPAKT